MDVSIAETVDQLEGYCKEIIKEDNEESVIGDLADKLLKVMENLPALDLSKPEQKNMQGKIESSAVNLWNMAVARRTGGTISSMLNARVRHIACNLVFLCHTGDKDEAAFKKQIMMAIKTGRAWLDCGNPSIADNSLTMAMECLEMLVRTIQEDSSGSAEGKEKSQVKRPDLDKDLFRVLCYKAESASAQGQHELALENIRRAKEMLHQIPKESSFLAMLCYNFGVECFQAQKYQESVTWLRESYELGKGMNSLGAKNQSRSLRLLANAYLEWDQDQHWQKALNAVGLANAEHSHPAGLFLKIRILLTREGNEDRIKSAFTDLLKHGDMTVDLGLSAMKLALKHDRQDAAIEGMKGLRDRFKNGPEQGKIMACHVEMLLQEKCLQQAKDLVEECIKDHHTGSPLEMSIKKRLHLLFWEKASEAFEAGDFKEALQWYNYSLSLYLPGESDDTNLAKLHRNRASCYLSLQQVDKAEEAVNASRKSDALSPYTQFIIFKLALMRDDDELAKTSLEKMGELSGQVEDQEECATGLICLAAQLAFEKSNRGIAMLALEGLSNKSSNMQQVLTALRCLTRLKLTVLSSQDGSSNTETGSILQHLQTALEKLKMAASEGKLDEQIIHKEALWFMKIAWNMALQSDDSGKEMQQFFLLCSELGELCPVDQANLVRQKTCFLMASAAALHQAKLLTDELEKRLLFKQALNHVEECKKICERLSDSRLAQIEGKGQDTVPVLLVLYEFEAKAKLGDPDLGKILEKALALPQTEPKTFETLAALCMEPPCNHRSISIRALKVAIKKHLQSDTIDFTKCSKSFHSLIQLSLAGGSNIDPASKEEAWGYYTDVLNVIETKAKDKYPEMEILWLMTKAWNCGIHLYSASRYMDAEKWCGLGMRLLKCLVSLKGNYEAQMSTVYGEILASLEANKQKGNYEE